MAKDKTVSWMIDGVLIGLIPIVALFFFFRGKLSKVVEESPPVPEWHTVSGRSRLTREFVWTATVQRPLGADETFRLRTTGQTRILDVQGTASSISLNETTGVNDVHMLGEAPWPSALKKDDCLRVVKAPDSLSVYLNGQRLLFAATAMETWRSSTWEIAGTAGAFAEFAYQKMGALLFADDFMHGEGELGEWRPVSGTWTVYALRNPIRSANPFSLWGRDDDAIIASGHWFWRNYTFDCNVHPLPGSGFGFYFGRQDEANSYELRWKPILTEDGSKDKAKDKAEDSDPEQGENEAEATEAVLTLARIVAGSRVVLKEKVEPFLPTQWMKVSIRQLEGAITVLVDDTPLLECIDPAPLLGGGIGFWTSGERGAVFDDVIVRSTDTVGHSFEGSPKTVPPPWLNVTTTTSPESKNGSPDASPLPSKTMTVTGIIRQDVALAADVSGLKSLRSPLELRAREDGAGNLLAFRISGGDSEPLAELILVHDTKPTVLEQAPLPALGDRACISLHTDGGDAWGALDGEIVCFHPAVAHTGRGHSSVVLPPDGSVVLEGLSLRPQEALPAIENRVETFTHETSMQNWSSPRLEWIPKRMAGGLVYWHRSDFWQDFSATVDKSLLQDQELGDRWGLMLTTSLDAENAGGAEIAVVKAEQGHELQLLAETEEPHRLPLQKPVSKIGISRRGGRLMVRLDGQIVWNEPVPTSLKGLCHIGRFGEGSSEPWAKAITIRAAGMSTYSFKQAPADWVPATGRWQVTNRWECDPRWSFFSGYQRPGVACIWNKRQHGPNVTLEFFAGPKMQSDRGKKYEYAADINAVLCADGKDLASGYNFMFGGWDDKGSYITRGFEQIGKNESVVIPRRSSTHRRWFHVKLRKQGNTLSFWVDGNLVTSVEDPTPLTGKRFGLWTWDNGIMVAQARISSDIDMSKSAVRPTGTHVPLTPYDTTGSKP